MEENFEIIQTQRGGRKILYEGYSFLLKKKLSGNRELFECSRRRDTPVCYSTLQVLNGKIIAQNDKHSHAPDAAKISASKVMAQIKKKSNRNIGAYT